MLPPIAKRRRRLIALLSACACRFAFAISKEDDMLRKLAIAAAAAVIASAGVVNSASAEFIRPSGGGGGGAMHFAPHGFSGGSMMRFGGRGFGGFAGARFFRPGGFVHYGAARYALGHVLPATAVGANSPYHHGWSGWRGYHRGWIGWGGPVFWPFAYDDLFDYAFWPYGPYDDLFWSYGYDDLFAGILLPYAMVGVEGGYGGYAYAPGRPAVAAAPQTGAGPSSGAPAPTSASQLCGSAQSLAGGAAIDSISKAVNPTGDQSAKLDALKNAEADAQKTLAASCAVEAPTTTIARLDAVETRLQAMIQAANAVGGPLGDFYASLNDEQKAAFNALGQNGPAANPAGAAILSQLCGPQNAVPVIATEQIDSAVQPDAKQQTALAALRDAAGKADDGILASCPKQSPLTPTGRLDAVKTRLQAMLTGVDLVKPPLQDFYASLGDAQKAKFDALTQPPASNEQNAKAQ
jgi:hypothetical protein